ncbi:MAG: hypothetical protein IT449_05570 [Phycisphaerales bacterium]|nr:hypothetical protein [Phycisphaerales bacterium]
MKIAITVCVAVLLVVAGAINADEYRSRVSDFDDIWEEGTNWEKLVGENWVQVTESSDYPDSCDDSVWIRDGYSITLFCPYLDCDGQVTCGQLLIDDGGIVWLDGGSKLTMCDTETSVIHGVMTTSCTALQSTCLTAELAIDGMVTIEGNGGMIITEDIGDHGVSALVITGEEGRLTIDGETPGDTATSMSIIARSNEIEIQAELSNLGDVVAEQCEGCSPSINLTTETKGGSGGFYRATNGPEETDGGTLEVHVPMSGSCDFQILAPSAYMLIAYPLTCYAGDFLLQKGTLELTERVCTTGTFTGGHHGASDDAFLIIRKGANNPPINKLLYNQDCGCQ